MRTLHSLLSISNKNLPCESQQDSSEMSIESESLPADRRFCLLPLALSDKSWKWPETKTFLHGGRRYLSRICDKSRQKQPPYNKIRNSVQRMNAHCLSLDCCAISTYFFVKSWERFSPVKAHNRPPNFGVKNTNKANSYKGDSFFLICCHFVELDSGPFQTTWAQCDNDSGPHERFVCINFISGRFKCYNVFADT